MSQVIVFILMVLILLTYFFTYTWGPVSLVGYMWRSGGRGPGISGLLFSGC
jgi:hypothetical protein